MDVFKDVAALISTATTPSKGAKDKALNSSESSTRFAVEPTQVGSRTWPESISQNTATLTAACRSVNGLRPGWGTTRLALPLKDCKTLWRGPMCRPCAGFVTD